MRDLTRRYFVLDRPSDKEFQALEICIGAMDTQTYSLDDSKIMVKTNQWLIDTYLSGDISELGTEYTLEEIKVLLRGPSWTDPTEEDE